MLNDLAESLQSAQILRLDRRGFGQLLLQCGKDLHTLDRIDTQVGIEGHLQFQHLFRITGFFSDDREQSRGDLIAVNGGGCNRLWRGSHSCRNSCNGRGHRLNRSNGSNRGLSNGGNSSIQRLALYQTVLLINQVEERVGRGFLTGKELLMQARRLLLQILQSLHALTGHLQGFLQGTGIGDRCRRTLRRQRLRNSMSDRRCRRGCNGCGLLRYWRTLFGAFEIVSAGQRNRHARLFALL